MRGKEKNGKKLQFLGSVGLRVCELDLTIVDVLLENFYFRINNNTAELNK